MVVAAAALSAIIGAGAGIGSYAYLAGGTTGIATSPISVTTVPAAQQPGPGRHLAAAAKPDRAVGRHHHRPVRPGRVAGTGVVLDKQGHILTNDHVVAGGREQRRQG